MKNVNTSVCEQFFSYLTKFRYSIRGFNYPISSLFTLLLFHLKNCHTIGLSSSAFGQAQKYFPSRIKPYFASPCVFDSIIIENNHPYLDPDPDNDDDDENEHSTDMLVDDDYNPTMETNSSSSSPADSSHELSNDC